MRIMVLGMLMGGMLRTILASEPKDTLILNRIYEHPVMRLPLDENYRDQVYTKIRFNVERRNPTLWLIPTMYVLAKGQREYIRETYSEVAFHTLPDFRIDRQLVAGTIRRNRKTMPTLLDFITPQLYQTALYKGHMLSPFNRVNRRLYRYSQKRLPDGTTRLDFRPRLYNTQLLNGYAIVESETGHIIKTLLNGEYDMITFRSEIQQNKDDSRGLLPEHCTTVATFRFLGNRITTLFDSHYNCSTPLPDSIDHKASRTLMDSIRPIPLTETDKAIYQAYDDHNAKEDASSGTVRHGNQMLKKLFWDTIGDNLVTPLATESDHAYLKLSPIINPLYISYSKSHGLRYKMRLRSRYNFSPHRYLTFNPTFGYSFKQRQFYFTSPLRMTYNPKRNGYAEVIYGNGNRISNSTVMDVINHAHQDTINLADTDLDKFTDNHLRVLNNIMIVPGLDIESGFVYHLRSALNDDLMHQYAMPAKYRSFAPMIGLKIGPWHRGPLLSVDWERGIKGILHSNLEYERWEFDVSWKRPIQGLRVLNLRAGGGLYTNKEQNIFVDFANFRDENLPEGWDDDWSGNFQLLRSQEYNKSDYYLRGNVSYESPLLVATWVPYLGKYIEKERFYISSVLLSHSRPYYELGYGFTNRYVSVGAFASFRNTHFDRIGVEFDFELFKRW